MNLQTVHNAPEVIEAKRLMNRLTDWLRTFRGLDAEWYAYDILGTVIAGGDITKVAIKVELQYYKYWKTTNINNYQIINLVIPDLAKVKEILAVIESKKWSDKDIILKLIDKFKV